MNRVYLLQHVDGKHYNHVTASLSKDVCEAVKASIEAAQPTNVVRGNLVIEPLRLIATLKEYETERIEREARAAINGLYSTEKTAILAYIQHLQERDQPKPVAQESV